MKRFIQSAIRFSLIILVLNITIFIVKEIVFSGYYRHSEKYNSYILADSHGWKLHDLPEKMGVANFSYHSESYFDMERKLRFLIGKGRVDTIYISADDHTLSPYREHSNNGYKSVKYEFSQGDYNLLDYAKFKLQYYIVIFDPNIRAIISNFLSELTRKTLGIGDRKKAGIGDTPWASLPREERLELAKARLIEQYPPGSPSKVLINSLQKIIETCKNNGITLIGIKFPLSKEYSEMIGDRSYKADSILISRGIRVLNFKDSFWENDTYLEDPDHINLIGAAKLIDSLRTML